LRLGAAKKEAGRAFGFVTMRVLKAEEECTGQTFSFAVKRNKLQAEQPVGQMLQHLLQQAMWNASGMQTELLG